MLSPDLLSFGQGIGGISAGLRGGGYLGEAENIQLKFQKSCTLYHLSHQILFV